MKNTFVTFLGLCSVLALSLLSASDSRAATFTVTVFAKGTGVGPGVTNPDSISFFSNAVTAGSLWVSYTDNSIGTGGGHSTVVKYGLNGAVLCHVDVPGSVDGLKVDPANGLVWAMQNQDANSTLTLINSNCMIQDVNDPYAVPSALRGYDDVAFAFSGGGRQTYLSYTHPVNPADPTIQSVTAMDPIAVGPVLNKGALGTNLATGLPNQPTTQNDPDSLKLTPIALPFTMIIPKGSLMLSSGDDGQLIFVQNPGLPTQAVSFITLLDPATGNPVAGLDDAVAVTAANGSFFLADTSNNRILEIEAQGLTVGSLFASVGSVGAFSSVNMATGKVTAVVPSPAPHGVAFVPNLP
jgi:hypothetical protein